MKKILLLMILLFLFSISAFAKDKYEVKIVDVKTNKIEKLSTELDYLAMQYFFDLELSESLKNNYFEFCKSKLDMLYLKDSRMSLNVYVINEVINVNVSQKVGDKIFIFYNQYYDLDQENMGQQIEQGIRDFLKEYRSRRESFLKK